MANTKKTKVQAEEVIDDEIIEEVEKEVKPAPKKVNKPKHDPNELILCRSVRFGELRLIGPKTRIPYEWSNEGDVREVEYQGDFTLESDNFFNHFPVDFAPQATKFLAATGRYLTKEITK